MSHHTRRLERLFLVRLWREEGDRPRALRGAAEDVAAGERFAFSDLTELDEFLRDRLYREDTDGT